MKPLRRTLALLGALSVAMATLVSAAPDSDAQPDDSTVITVSGFVAIDGVPARD